MNRDVLRLMIAYNALPPLFGQRCWPLLLPVPVDFLMACLAHADEIALPLPSRVHKALAQRHLRVLPHTHDVVNVIGPSVSPLGLAHLALVVV